LEKNLSTLSGLDSMTSTSEEGMAHGLSAFDWSSPIDEVDQDILTAMNQVEIADDANAPRFMKLDPSTMGMRQMAITSSGDDVINFQDDVKDFETELERINGVANVNYAGGLTEQFEVNINQKKLKENKLTQDDIVNLINAHEI